MLHKNLIAILSIFLLTGTVSLTASSCNSDNKAKSENIELRKKESKEIVAYYFHATRRCATCKAVEKVTTETLSENFKDVVVFKSINREEKENKALVRKYKVSGQTLIITKGSKVINLTTDAFMNARTNPEKFEKKLKETIESLM